MNPSIAKITRTEINRANAKHSTGPKTEAGKHRSSLNALRHGLTGQTIVLPSDDLKSYQDHIQNFVNEYHPQGATESQLVQSLADTAWRQNRAAALETNLITLALEPHQPDDQVQQSLTIAAALDNQARALSTLSIHTQRLARQFEKTLALLHQIQSTRLEARQKELEQAANLVQMHQKEKEPYHPAEDGFVFSNDEIDQFLRLRDRQARAAKAFDYCNPENQVREIIAMWVDPRTTNDEPPTTNHQSHTGELTA
jgi:hypothetical protein